MVSNLLVAELLSLIFGAYFFLVAKEWLPAYYDENRLNFYNDGFFRMSIPALSSITEAGRIFCAPAGSGL